MLASIVAAIAVSTVPSSPLPLLTVRGDQLVDPQGRAVLLKGCNLGNWLMLEMWMLCLQDSPTPPGDQHGFLNLLRERFGVDETERLMDLYRSHWITERDFPIIRQFGFNVVRLPIDYRLLEDDANPMTLRSDAFEWIDKAVDMAETAGIYTILDLHGVQGGQSPYDHTGHAGQNRLWSVAKNEERAAWLWREMARRYKDRSAVVAYDLINEPYGGQPDELVRVFEKLVRAVREVDSEKLVFVAGSTAGIDFYGDPKDRGWHNVGFTEHYYPGLFGNGQPTELTHAKHLARLPIVDEKLERMNVNYLVGEMNVVFNAAGGAAMMRRTYDTHARLDWHTTMWSYKALSHTGGHGDASWGMVTNKQPAWLIDLKTAPLEEVERYMKHFSSQEYAINQPLMDWMTRANPDFPTLPEVPEAIRVAPADERLPGWRSTDIGGPRQGGLQRVGDDTFRLYGGGSDIWAGSDQFRFLHRTLRGDGAVEVELLEVPDVNSYTKAGVMLRAGTAPDAPCVLLSCFPGGELQFAYRLVKGSSMVGDAGVSAGLPVRLRLVREGQTFTAQFQRGQSEWQTGGTVEWPTAPTRLQAGVVALSHDDTQLVQVVYRGLRLSAK